MKANASLASPKSGRLENFSYFRHFFVQNEEVTVSREV